MACTLSLPLPARALCAVTGDGASTSSSQWLAGTTSLREENEVRLLAYDAGADALTSTTSWVHPEEVWDLAPCPGQPSRLASVHARAGAYGCSLWCAGEPGSALAPLAQLKHAGTIRRVLWSGLSQQQLVTVEEGALRCWSLSDAGAAELGAAGPGEPEAWWTAALHPRKHGLALVAAGSSVRLWDLGSMQQAGSVARAHSMPVRCVSWAPSNEHRFVSGGDDCKLRFWDTRKLDSPESLLELSGHSHWVWSAAFSPFHEPLLLSSSTDTTVAVWYTPGLAKQKGPDVKQQGSSISKAAGGGRAGEVADGRVASFDEHEDSVYGLAWSAADPWLFASMSHDGRVVLNRVPKSVKYRLML